MTIMGGIFFMVVGLGAMYLGWRYIKQGRAAAKKANLKVDFEDVPIANGFAVGLIGTIIIFTGLIGLIVGITMIW